MYELSSGPTTLDRHAPRPKLLNKVIKFVNKTINRRNRTKKIAPAPLPKFSIAIPPNADSKISIERREDHHYYYYRHRLGGGGNQAGC